MKYPIGIQTFEKIIKEGYVYVDKTDMVYALATEGNTYFLSRPRRFGKSLLLSTLRAYFEGKKELFKGLKIDKLEKDWHVHRVFHFDFNSVNFTQPNALEETLTMNYHNGKRNMVLKLNSRISLAFGWKKKSCRWLLNKQAMEQWC